MRSEYRITPGERLEVEVVQSNGARALVVGILDSAPVGAHGRALRIRIVQAEVRALEAEG